MCRLADDGAWEKVEAVWDALLRAWLERVRTDVDRQCDFLVLCLQANVPRLVALDGVWVPADGAKLGRIIARLCNNELRRERRPEPLCAKAQTPAERRACTHHPARLCLVEVEVCGKGASHVVHGTVVVRELGWLCIGRCATKEARAAKGAHGPLFSCDSTLSIEPKVGDFYFFPNYLMHAVYPFFDSKEERRSVSFNARIDEETFNVYG